MDATERKKQLYLLFKNAVEAERRAQHTYQQAAELCDDPQFKRILEAFYKDELRHEQAIMEQYARLRDEIGTD